ncbi:GDP-mannose 4,6-dehydratase [Clostridium gelidum]|uniref:GDP-mannose 4,6-dehydratase n=1 Tax=Clostridium gelidum TaxID=704125 RepID=A0ABN6J2W0_9CLOT|nr:GDP-mannose 4,6-dehydratase [Clostridium gelidum]BCZ47102.1 GDP-mannose 4,6-dehydratase [Clostridium gelidum]
MTILVTGAGGMVGSHMVEFLYEQGVEVVGTYYKPTVDLKEINQKIKLIECDVRYCQSVEKVISEFQPTQIYHLAAQSYPTVSWERPYETIDTNIGGTIAIFEAIKKVRLVQPQYDPVVVVACSSAEYGATLEELKEPKVKETAELKPLHPYGVSKVGQDLLAYQYYVNYGIRTIRARIFNTTGTRKVNDVTSDFTMRAISQEKAGTKHPILHVGNIETQRAIMDFKDLLKGLTLLAEKGTYGEVYNISSERIYPIKEIIDIIENQMRVKFELNVDQKLIRPTDEKIIVGDVTKLKRDTGWKQTITLEQTVSEMLDYWRMKLV